MISLLLSILTSSIILIIFKVAGRKGIPALFLVIINYFAASFCGFMLSGSTPFDSFNNNTIPWLPIVGVGAVFVFTFFLIGETTRKSGIAVTTIAAKMSFVFPIALSFLIDPNDKFTIAKFIIIMVSIVAVVLTVYKKNDATKRTWVFPVLLFVLLGFADSVVKYMQTFYIKDIESSSLFSATLFMVSSMIGIIIWLFYKPNRWQIFKPLTLSLGLIVGVLNFGSLYFFINALNELKINSSIVFGVNNLGIVVLSVSVAIFIFSEKVLTINKIGIALSLVAVGLMMFFL